MMQSESKPGLLESILESGHVMMELELELESLATGIQYYTKCKFVKQNAAQVLQLHH